MADTSKDVTLLELIAILRAAPDNVEALRTLLDHVEQEAKAYFHVGEQYVVPVRDVGYVTKELHSIGARCRVECLSRGCPGLLMFRDGQEACPLLTPIKKSVSTDMFFLPLKLVQRLLYRGVSRGQVDLPDGRQITFTIKDRARRPNQGPMAGPGNAPTGTAA